VQCRVRRDKDGVQGGFYPTFYLQAERPSDKKKVLIKTFVEIFIFFCFSSFY
jgi:hypothetical protein